MWYRLWSIFLFNAHFFSVWSTVSCTWLSFPKLVPWHSLYKGRTITQPWAATRLTDGISVLNSLSNKILHIFYISLKYIFPDPLECKEEHFHSKSFLAIILTHLCKKNNNIKLCGLYCNSLKTSRSSEHYGGNSRHPPPTWKHPPGDGSYFVPESLQLSQCKLEIFSIYGLFSEQECWFEISFSF